MKLKNITYNEYFELEDKKEYDFAIKYAKELNEPKDIFGIGDFTELTFKTVKDMQYYIENGLEWNHIFELIETTKGKTYKEIGVIYIKDLCMFKSYVVEEIYRINKIESIALAHQSTSEEENAGIDDLAELGSYLQFRSLANEDVLKIEAVGQLKYSACLLELVARKKIDEYQKAFIRNKSKKAN